MSTPATSVRAAQSKQNVYFAKRNWGSLSRMSLAALRELTRSWGFCVATGDLLYIDGRWYVTHSGLLRLACRCHCYGILVQPVPAFCDAGASRWAFSATVYKSPKCRGFVGFGDADPANVSETVRGAEMRVAETRAVNRALRKAYGIGLCSVEEIGPAERPRAASQIQPGFSKSVPPGDGHPRLRDRLLLLIRQFGLDGEQVKRYALNFCGTATLHEASREQVEKLVDHLATIAAEGQAKLLAEVAPSAQRGNQSREEEAA